MSIHDGHRKRMKDRFRKEGLDHFADVHVLELLLYYSVPRQDTNLLAHRLLEHFGSFSRVLDASAEELEKVEGIGENIATFLSLYTAVWRYYMVNQAMENVVLKTLDMCGDYLLPHFIGRTNETVFLLCLDAKCKVLCCREIGEGSINTAAISTRKVVEVAMVTNATTVVLAHNHPSGIALPSDEDVITTRRIAHALRAVEIQLADHIVVADGDYVSMAQSGMYDPYDEPIVV